MATIKFVGDITIGIFYQMPDGQIALTVGANSPREEIGYLLDDDYGTRVAPFSEVSQTWVKRADLKDFPNARDPRLPNLFDLFWDIKTEAILKEVLEEGRHPDIEEIRNSAQEYGYLDKFDL